MRNRGLLFFGLFLVLIGVLSLLSNLFNIDFGAFCWPIALIAVGVWLVLRPRMVGPDGSAYVSLIGDLRRRGNWLVRNEEFWVGVGDVELDFSEAVVPEGESTLRVYTFVSDVNVFVPRSMGVTVRANGFVIDANVLGRKYDTFLTPVEATSENYASAAQCVRIELTGFVADLSVKQL